MTTIENIKSLIQKVLHSYNHLSCYLFGSYAKGKANEQSDVDIFMLFDKNHYEYKEILSINALIKSEFEKVSIYCEPIYGYIQNINDDKAVLYRQYIGYGKHLFGDNIKKIMIQETLEQQKQIEYENWRAMIFDKMRTLEYLVQVNPDIDESTLAWEFLYLIAYWNAKAELTLVDKQHSLNEFTLTYIYCELLQMDLNEEVLYTLELLQNYRDKIKEGDFFDIEFEPFVKHFDIAKYKLIGSLLVRIIN